MSVRRSDGSIGVVIILVVIVAVLAYQFGMGRAFDRAGMETYRAEESAFMEGVCRGVYDAADRIVRTLDVDETFATFEADATVVDIALIRNRQRTEAIQALYETEPGVTALEGEYVCSFWPEDLRRYRLEGP